MTKYVSAKEFRKRLPDVVEDLKHWGEIVVIKRSKPLFKVVPFEESPSDILDRAAANQDNGQPDLQEISRIIHKIREIK
jgi:antitoxin (DNA-binding transcriptional repressor) of toxin-antitoxin stability system